MTTTDRLSLLENMGYYYAYHRFNVRAGLGFYDQLLKSQDVSRRERKRLRKAFRLIGAAG